MTAGMAIKLAGRPLNKCGQRARIYFCATATGDRRERSPAINGSVIRQLKHLVGVPLSQYLKKSFE
jgi:hypothetical protein